MLQKNQKLNKELPYHIKKAGHLVSFFLLEKSENMTVLFLNEQIQEERRLDGKLLHLLYF
jgi:hypothetical protein